MKKNYLGFGCSQDAPSLALVDSDGHLVFAEAVERFLQYKRGWLCPPTLPFYTAGIIQEYGETGADIVASTSWSQRYLQWAGDTIATTPDASIAQSLQRQIQMIERSFFAAPDLKISEIRTNHDHHLSHAAAGCYTSSFDECVCAVVDAWGEASSHAIFHYQNGEFTPIDSGPTEFDPQGLGPSLGIFYETLCELCGFNFLKGEEWKVMGLAAYGSFNQEIYDVLTETLSVSGLRLLQGTRYEELSKAQLGIGELAKFAKSPGVPAIAAADLAFTGQFVFAEKMNNLLQNIHNLGVSDNLVFSGGCALNSSYNGQALENTGFQKLHVWCAPSDDGNAVGAAWLAFLEDHPDITTPPRSSIPYLGSRVSHRTLDNLSRFGDIEGRWLSGVELVTVVADLLAAGKIVGWVQGRAEFGPRALGNRSILADARNPQIKDVLNERVKFREEFRPFAPAILHEFGPSYFENYCDNFFMERALKFKESVVEKVPGVVHEDMTGRVQSVTSVSNQKFHALIRAFYERTGIPLLLNTSFNVMGKPIIHSVEDALAVFFTSGMDALAIENYFILKRATARKLEPTHE